MKIDSEFVIPSNFIQYLGTPFDLVIQLVFKLFVLVLTSHTQSLTQKYNVTGSPTHHYIDIVPDGPLTHLSYTLKRE